MRYKIQYIVKSRRLFKKREVFDDGAFVEMRATIVPVTNRTPEGIKYSLAYVRADGVCVLRYDNAEGKGHHRHTLKSEEAIEFKSLEELTDRFMAEVNEMWGKS